jgi:hypothetical protein
MTPARPALLKIAGTLVVILILGALIVIKAEYTLAHQDFHNSNFFFFWLAGHMIWARQNPYDPVQWLAGHAAYGVTWRPNRIFPYPLPLALVLAPLGLLGLAQAYLAWQIFTQLAVCTAIWILLGHWEGAAHRRLLAPLAVAMLFFGPVYLNLNVGSDGALALIFSLAALRLLERDRGLWAGAVLSLTILKPPQGLTLLLLAVVWFALRRHWKAILGIVAGGVALLAVGLIQDPHWVSKFLTAGQAVMDRTQGVQSNVWAFAYLACGEAQPCASVLGGLLALLGLAGTSYYLWAGRARLSDWEALCVIIPVAFTTTIYLWSYDQFPYIIAIVWIIGTLVERTHTYVFAFLFLILLDLASLLAMALLAGTGRDLWSLANTFMVLGASLWLLRAR